MAEAYKQAGVNVDAGYEAVNRIKPHAMATKRPGVLGGLGGFGGMFDLSALQMKEPVLVSGTDGVGTKLMLAFEMDRHDTIGIDAVAMCVNDIVAQGAEPLYFLDYIACGELQPEKIEAVVSGIAEGCKQAGAALVGGETAEMPGMYETEEYDIAGFAVGAVEKSQLMTGESIESGDLLVGLASNGVHSNGFSLVRKIIREKGLDLAKQYEGLGRSLGEELLQPTRIYVKPLLSAMKNHDIKGIAHITGGGFGENVPRMLPDGLGADIDEGSWPVPPIFRLLQSEGQLETADLAGTFNMGIGMILAVSPEEAAAVIRDLEQNGEKAYIIGRVTEGVGVAFGGERL
ncbi:MAG TPA: phosphoribosylformylglycinamidine cyclo-ligase [Bacillales bacterium]|nr:phosphoribosylformylglycinamidine cyclo-ligase [Bacillales bacterium]